MARSSGGLKRSDWNATLGSILSLDFSGPPTPKRRAALEKRLARLRAIERSAASATIAFQRAAKAPEPIPLRLRPGFVYLAEPAPGGSDRRVPPRASRPPATQISTSRGAALRLELIALALAQARHRPGMRAANPLPLLPDRAAAKPLGWVDLIASPATHHSGKVSTTVNDKKIRQLQNGLDRLEDAGLVLFPHREDARNSREGFELLDERGRLGRPGLSPLEYRVPMTSRDPVFEMPAGFVANGWIHLLEDSEISLLLMVACGYGRNPGEGDWVAVPGDVRLLQYGISRDAFDAHRLLNRSGLLSVFESGRRDDGRAIGYNEDDGEAHLHRLQLLRQGFDSPAFSTLTSAIEEDLAWS